MAHSVFIQGTNKRYSISKDGEVFSHYRYLSNGKKISQLKEIAKHINCRGNNTVVVKLQIGKHKSKNSGKTFFVNKLMEMCFDLNPPDRFHAYYLSYKDGNCFNVSIKNLVYKIRLQVGSSTKFYPKPFYNLNGTITHKVCGDCGKKKTICHFVLQKSGSRRKNKTYRNSCETCRLAQRVKMLKANAVAAKKHKDRAKKWQNSVRGKEYNINYRKEQHTFHFKNVSPHYIATSLRLYKDGLSAKDMTPELISAARKRILLTRQIKTQTQKNQFTP